MSPKRNFVTYFSFLILPSITAVTVGLFIFKFDGGLSNEQQDWGAFGSYISGTVGVLAACLAVIWLIRSVSIQQTELEHLKKELKSSSDEQKKQTHTSALTALLTSNQQAVANDRTLLYSINNGSEGVDLIKNHGKFILDYKTTLIKARISFTLEKIEFYEKQLENYLTTTYVPTDDD
jgi:hypothetical protein